MAQTKDEVEEILDSPDLSLYGKENALVEFLAKKLEMTMEEFNQRMRQNA